MRAITNHDQSCNALQDAIARKTADVARMLGLSTSTISKWQEPYGDWSDSGARNPIDRLEALMCYCESYNPKHAHDPLRFLANKFNYDLVSRPTLPAEDLTTIDKKLANSIKEFGGYIQSVGTAMADGRLTFEECRNIITEATETIEAIHCIRYIAQRHMKNLVEETM